GPASGPGPAAAGGDVEVRDRPHPRRRTRPRLCLVPAAVRSQADAVLRGGGGVAVPAGLCGGRRRALAAVRAPPRGVPTAARPDHGAGDIGYRTLRLRLRGGDAGRHAGGRAGSTARDRAVACGSIERPGGEELTGRSSRIVFHPMPLRSRNASPPLVHIAACGLATSRTHYP